MNDCITPLKRCVKCGEEKPLSLEYFPKRSTSRDGFRNECKPCLNKRGRERAANRDYSHIDYTIPKQCTVCEQYFSRTTDHFYPNGKTVDGLTTICRSCHLASKRKYYAQNTDKMTERRRKWSFENPEGEKAIAKRWRSKHPEKVRLNHALWRSENRIKARNANRKREAKKKSLPSTFTHKHAALAINYFNGLCAVCERPLRDLFGTHTASWDHWIPLSKDGGSTPDNMVPLCIGVDGCNNSKRHTMPDEWLIKRFGVRRGKQILKRINTFFEWMKAQENDL